MSGEPIATSICEHCNKYCLWQRDAMVYPNRGSVPPPSADMPPDVAAAYEEAASIASASPRAAAALLRLAIQLLCIHLGGKGENINEDIGRLVSAGLPTKIQKALDLVRVIGNNAVHPGQILAGDPTVAAQLFRLLNLIVDTMITVPKDVDKMYETLPGSARTAVEKRDAKPK